MRVDTCKKLEETLHLHVRHLCQDSTFHYISFYFNFFQVFFFPKSKLLNSGCGLSGSVAYTPVFTVVNFCYACKYASAHLLFDLSGHVRKLR